MAATKKNLRVELLELNEGQMYGLPKNPRWIRDARFDALKKSIEDAPEMLDLREILVYPLTDLAGHEDHYIVIGGNMRLRACIEIGYKEVPCKVLDIETPVKKLREYVIKDNQAFGQDDYDLLADEWSDDELQDWGFELPSEFFSSSSGEEEENTRTEGEDDDYDPDQEVEERVKRGEIWQLGEHRLMCGDSTDLGDVERLMDGKLADLWLTDPPYNVNYGADMTVASGEKRTIENDNMEESAFHEFLLQVYQNAVDSMRPGATFYVCHADSEGLNFRSAAQEAGLKVRQCLIWKKDSLVLGRQDYHWIHEPILTGWKEGAAHSWYNDRKQTTVLEFDRPKKSELHPTMKPVPLFVYLVQNSSKKGELVLDLFGGSGTTIIACEQTGRVGYAMELDEHYASIIVDRWEKYTGKTAQKIS